MQLQYSHFTLEAGCDEAGRGCLAGSVVAAAVILPHHFFHKDLNDSKQISAKKREELAQIIKEQALDFTISEISEEEIDRINILNASILAMHHSLQKLKSPIEFISVDGNRFKKFNEIPHQTLIKGDANYMNIAAASILAKTHRDELMLRLHEEFPMYNWKQNKGYPTAEHRKAIEKFGVTKYHRKSFKLFDTQLALF